MSLTRSLTAGAALLLFFTLAPAHAFAQICVGSPAGPGEFTLGAAATVSDGEFGGFLQGRANLDGPIAFESRIGIEQRVLGTNALIAGGTLSFDLPVGGVRLCPTGGFTHVIWEDRSGDTDVSRSELAVPLGVAAGVRRNLGGAAAVIPWVHSGILPSRLRLSVPAAGGETDFSRKSDVGTFLSAGGSFLLPQVFLRAGVALTTLEGSEPVFSVELGITL